MSDELEIWENGFVKGFKFIPYDAQLEGNILGLHEGQQVERLIRRKKKKTTSETHGYYRGVVLPAAKQSETFRGWSLVDIHKYYASLYLKDVVEKELDGITVLIVTTLSTGEVGQKRMNRYIEDVVKDLNEHGIIVPEPQKQTT